MFLIAKVCDVNCEQVNKSSPYSTTNQHMLLMIKTCDTVGSVSRLGHTNLFCQNDL